MDFYTKHLYNIIMSGNFVFQSCSFCDQEYEKPSIFISNYNEVWICRNCDNLMFPKDNTEHGDCCACLKNKNVLSLRNCIHKVCSECFKETNFGSIINPKKWHGVEIPNDPPKWPFEIKKEDDSDPEYIKSQEYLPFFHNICSNEISSYDEKITNRNNLMSTRPEWMNTEIFINFENKHLKYITDFFKKVNDFDDYNKKAKDGDFCPLCRKK